jgi:anti-sigma regulatory factor (Ser/Thr protein kinase)
MGYIKYKAKNYKTVCIKLSSSSDFNDLLKEFHALSFSKLEKKIENIRYAILELVNNAMRAHKECNSDAQILLDFSMNDEFLKIQIKDAGGGFDISLLPYDLNQNISDIDMNNPSFQDYREKHGYKRFGMGLLVTKRTFDYFNISFYDKRGSIVPWKKESVVGTIVEMRSNISK